MTTVGPFACSMAVLGGLDERILDRLAAHVRRITTTDVELDLEGYLRLVRLGETIELVEGAKVIARIAPIEESLTPRQRRFHELVELGVIRPPERPLRLEDLRARPIPCSSSLVQAVIEDRDDR